MKQFKVLGRKYTDYYTKVYADDAYQAIDVANAQDTINWFQLEDDDTIEAMDVVEWDEPDSEFDDIKLNKDKENIQLNSSNDEWPDMGNGILVEL
jgi:hypothetical protein